MSNLAKHSRTQWLSRSSAIALAAGLALPAGAYAQDDTTVGELIITATRRAETVQDVPFNISAVGAAEIEEQGLSDLSEVAQWVPGVYIGDIGSRGSSRIVVRGLNATPAGAAEAVNNDGGGTVATYVGEIPVYLDLKLNDLERAEFLLGPQGTLYGAGTLGGAIRYIPVKPKLGVYGGAIRAEAFDYSKGATPGYDIGGTVNIPIGETFAVRANIDYLHDNGFVDYKYLVREIGVSEPDPDFTDPADVAANLRSQRDVNTEEALSGRLALRWQPTEKLDATLTYYYQDVDSGGRQISQHRLTSFPVPIDEYESAQRVLEPQTQTNELLALEGSYDLGFAELTSATGLSRYKEAGQRDQTDFLITLEYSYEAFPTFTAFTREDQKTDIFTQELRLVSKGTGPFSYIGGLFYNHVKDDGSSKEFTPFYAEFNGSSRPDSLEYINISRTKLEEMAAYGEISYDITPAWSVTAGGRYFNYDLTTSSATDVPLFNTVFDGAPADQILLDFTTDKQKDNGFLYKFNTSYNFTDEIMSYATVSQGYRIGGFNGLSLCGPVVSGQTVCASQEELFYQPDKTTNYEIGLKTRLFDKRLTLNGSIYYIKWEDIQLDSASVAGAAPITKNGSGARSIGIETSFEALLNEHWSMRGSYSHTEAELTADAPDLVRYIVPPGFSTRSNAVYFDGKKGDRLPGSPENQASIFASYKNKLSNGIGFEANYGIVYVGEILTRTGDRGFGITLPSYSRHNASLAFSGDTWTTTLFAENLLDKLSESGSRATPRSNQTLTDADGGDVNVRSFFTYVLPPRSIGVRISRSFGAG